MIPTPKRGKRGAKDGVFFKIKHEAVFCEKKAASIFDENGKKTKGADFCFSFSAIRGIVIDMDGRRRLQLAELAILKEVKTFFDDNGLRYVALGGTLLGAVRHHGFIPWDDDVDVGLPRPDYERFLALAKEKYPQGGRFVLESFTTDEGYPYYFSRVTDRSVTVTDRSATVEKKQPAWIDVFPLDGMPGGLKGKIHRIRLLYARMAFQYSRFDELVNVHLPHRPWYERVLIAIGKVIPVQKLFSTRKALLRLDRLLKKYDYETSPYAVNFMGAGKFKEMHERSVYDERAEYVFEDTTVMSVRDADKWLTQMYGDYMTPPKEEERNKHCTAVAEEETE